MFHRFSEVTWGQELLFVHSCTSGTQIQTFIKEDTSVDSYSTNLSNIGLKDTHFSQPLAISVKAQGLKLQALTLAWNHHFKRFLKLLAPADHLLCV